MTLVRELRGPHCWTQGGPSWHSVMSSSWASHLTHPQRWQAGHLAMTLDFAAARWHQRKGAGVGTLAGLCATEAFVLLSQAPSRGCRQDRAPGFSGKLGKQAFLSCLGVRMRKAAGVSSGAEGGRVQGCQDGPMCASSSGEQRPGLQSRHDNLYLPGA